MTPVLIDKQIEIEVPEEETIEVMIDVPVIIEVLKERKVPVTLAVQVEIDVPVEIDQEITE